MHDRLRAQAIERRRAHAAHARKIIERRKSTARLALVDDRRREARADVGQQRKFRLARVRDVDAMSRNLDARAGNRGVSSARVRGGIAKRDQLRHRNRRDRRTKHARAKHGRAQARARSKVRPANASAPPAPSRLAAPLSPRRSASIAPSAGFGCPFASITPSLAPTATWSRDHHAPSIHERASEIRSMSTPHCA